MKRVVVSVVLLAAVLVYGVGASVAAGDRDGVWAFNLFGTTIFATIHQNDAAQGTLGFNMLIGLMDPVDGTWTYATATRNGNGNGPNAQGPVFDGADAFARHHVANINITFTSSTTFTGTFTTGGVDTPISGQKVF